MGQLVAAFGLSHAPGLTGNPEATTPEKRAKIYGAWSQLKEEFERVRPDILIGVSNDHFQNFHRVQPPFCVGVAESHTFPRAAYAKSLRLTPHPVPGHPEFAQSLLNAASDDCMDLTYSEELEFQDEFSIPKHFLDPEDKVPIVPIVTNCLNRNQPTPPSFYRLGQTIARAVRMRPSEERIVVMGTGGLAHDPTGPNWCIIDEQFDREFLKLLVEGETESLMKEFTLGRMFKSGKGGTPEILNWFAPLGAVGAGTRATLLCYEPVPEWATGIGLISWDV
jgi:aromatic ring-opening dioxygenase catalytic subunit (LigB family)